jgi:hypothetical protein
MARLVAAESRREPFDELPALPAERVDVDVGAPPT